MFTDLLPQDEWIGGGIIRHQLASVGRNLVILGKIRSLSVLLSKASDDLATRLQLVQALPQAFD